MKITGRTVKIEKKLSVTVLTRYTIRLELPDNLWIPFLNKSQSYVVISSMIYFDIYKYMVTKWKHGIYIHKKSTFNESLDNASMSILEPTKIGESYYEDGFAMFKT